MRPIDMYDAAMNTICNLGASQEDVDGCDALRHDYQRMQQALEILRDDPEIQRSRYLTRLVQNALERSAEPSLPVEATSE